MVQHLNIPRPNFGEILDMSGQIEPTQLRRYSRDVHDWADQLRLWLENYLTGGYLISTIEVDLGTIPRQSGTFVITDDRINVGEQLLVTQAGGSYTGKGTLADEAEMDGLICMATCRVGAADVYWTCNSFVVGKFKFNYLVE